MLLIIRIYLSALPLYYFRKVHNFCLLLCYVAYAICPYLVSDTRSALHHQDKFNPRLSDQEIYNYVAAVAQGISKVMAKMGISTLHKVYKVRKFRFTANESSFRQPIVLFILFLAPLTRRSAQRSWWYYWFVRRPSSSVVRPSTFALNCYSSYSSYSIILNFLLEKLGI